jgi:type VI secretion system Hcp family effector
MAETISLVIYSNGTDPSDIIHGDCTVSALDRADTIEVLSFEQQLLVPFDRATLQATGRRIYAPLKFSKRLDKSTPLLRKACTENQVMVGTFNWYRPTAAADGTTEKFFTLAFTGGRITKCTLRLPDTLLPDTRGLPPLEDIELSFVTINWTWLTGGITHEDTWGPGT